MAKRQQLLSSDCLSLYFPVLDADVGLQYFYWSQYSPYNPYNPYNPVKNSVTHRVLRHNYIYEIMSL